MNDKWRYVEKDGNPNKEGVYFVVLVYDEWYGGKPTGRQFAAAGTRYFCDAEACGLQDWVMTDQPEHGLVWTEESGSYANEKVICWLPNESMLNVKLPDGVVWEDTP